MPLESFLVCHVWPFLVAALATVQPGAESVSAPPSQEEPRTAASSDFAFLGVQTSPRISGDDKSGLLVTHVFPDSSAEQMGFEIGDEVKFLNDVVVTDHKGFADELRRLSIGSKVRILVRRSGQDVTLTGRIGSYASTMKAYQESLRKAFVGKPLPQIANILWWKPSAGEGKAEAGSWETRPPGWESLRGKVAVVTSFDDCPFCREKKLPKIGQMARVFAAAGATTVAFAGIFYDDRPDRRGKEPNLKAAQKLFLEAPPRFPVGVAFYPGDIPPSEERRPHFLIREHGTVILDPEGNVAYLQTVGPLEKDFLDALDRVLRPASGTGKPAVEKPTARPPGGAEPAGSTGAGPK